MLVIPLPQALWMLAVLPQVLAALNVSLLLHRGHTAGLAAAEHSVQHVGRHLGLRVGAPVLFSTFGHQRVVTHSPHPSLCGNEANPGASSCRQ